MIEEQITDCMTGFKVIGMDLTPLHGDCSDVGGDSGSQKAFHSRDSIVNSGEGI